MELKKRYTSNTTQNVLVCIRLCQAEAASTAGIFSLALLQSRVAVIELGE